MLLPHRGHRGGGREPGRPSVSPPHSKCQDSVVPGPTPQPGGGYVNPSASGLASELVRWRVLGHGRSAGGSRGCKGRAECRIKLPGPGTPRPQRLAGPLLATGSQEKGAGR